jgi:2-dehydro-3-deoxy-D-gluconate 5-dehydrogenase
VAREWHGWRGPPVFLWRSSQEGLRRKAPSRSKIEPLATVDVRALCGVAVAASLVPASIAKRLVQAGANVLLTDIDNEVGEAAAAALCSGPGKAVYLHADVTDPRAGPAMVDQCVRQFGTLDILVNAGIYPSVPMLETTPELFDRVYAINLKGLAFCSKAAARQLVAQGSGGAIINIASVDGLHPSMVGLAAYDASKGGVIMFTKNLALELVPHGIRVNAIAPGGVTTEGTSRPLAGSGMTQQQLQELQENFVRTKIPLRRMGQPDDIATVVVGGPRPCGSYQQSRA